MSDESCARPVRLGAALFNGDHGHLADEVRRLEAAGLDLIHLDVFDGYFVSDLGFPVHTIAALRPLTKLPFEVHVGVVEPRRFIAPLVDAGADPDDLLPKTVVWRLDSFEGMSVREGWCRLMGLQPVEAAQPS